MNKRDKEIIQQYGVAVWHEQQKHWRSIELPPLPKFLSREVKTILTAYRNMARVWDNNNLPVPNPMDHLHLLQVMGDTSITFGRRNWNGKFQSVIRAKEGAKDTSGAFLAYCPETTFSTKDTPGPA